MATFTFDNPTQVFPEGTTVFVYRDKGQPPGEAPAGNPTSSATVTNGNLTVASLTDLTPYFATAYIDSRWRRIRFTTDPGAVTTTGGGGGGTPVDISGKEDKSNRAVAGGYAPLDASNFVPWGHLQRVTPGEIFVDEVGAVGDGVTDDTNAIRLAITLAAHLGHGTIRFGAHPYLVNGDPLTTANGNAILPIPESSAFGLQDQLVFEGVPGRTRIRTTRTGDAYSATFGPPSILGGPTWEQVSPDGTAFSQRYVRIKDMKFEAPLNPSIAAIDLGRCVRCQLERVSVGIIDNLYDTQQPTHIHSFGVRLPDPLNHGQVEAKQCQIAGYYCGMVLSTSHTLIRYVTTTACYIGYGLVGSGEPNPDPQRSEGIVTNQHCPYAVAGYTPAGGVRSLPVGKTAHVEWFLTMEDIFPGWEDPSGDWRQPVAHILDQNDMIDGRIKYLLNEGYVGESDNLVVDGGDNIQISNDRIPKKRVAAETTPASGVSYENTYDDNHHTVMRVRVQLSPQASGSDAFFPAVVAADSPTAFYRLDEGSGTTVSDSGAGAHHGTYVGGPALTGAGPVGDFTTHTSALFDGTNDHALLTTLGTLGNNLVNGSSEFWIKTNSNLQGSVFGTENAGSSMLINCLLNTAVGVSAGGYMSLHMRGANGVALNAWANVPQMYDDTWHHVVWVSQAGLGTGVHKCYLDGWEVACTASGSGAMSTAAFTSPMTLAAHNDDGTIGNFADVELANVAFYTTRLSQARAQAHYATGVGAAVSSLEVSEDNNVWRTWGNLMADPGVTNARSDGYTFSWPPRTFFRVTHAGAYSVEATRSSSRS